MAGQAKTNGKPSRVIDANAIRAARAEAKKEQVLVLVGDEEVLLPAEMPAQVAFLVGEGDIGRGLDLLLGDKANVYWAQDPPPSIDEVNAFFDEIAKVYGFGSVGESSASAGS